MDLNSTGEPFILTRMLWRRPGSALSIALLVAAAPGGCGNSFQANGDDAGIGDAGGDGYTGDAPPDAPRADAPGDGPGQGDGDAGLGPDDCGDTSGLQQGAPWPMEGRCPTHAGRAAADGPMVNSLAHFGTVAGYPKGVVVANDGTLYVCDSNGTLWSFTSDLSMSKALLPSGTCASTPAIAADGTVYVGTTIGHLAALNPDGTPKWPPAILDGTSPVTSPNVRADGKIFAGAGTFVYEINPGGTVSQFFQIPSGVSVSASVAIGLAGDVFVPADKLYAVKSDGTLRWSVDPGHNVLPSYPVVDKNGTVFLGDTDAVAIDTNGNRIWKVNSTVFTAAPALGADDIVYFGGLGGHLLALDRATGNTIWSAPLGAGADVQVAPAVDKSRTVYVGTAAATLLAYSSTGTQIFNATLPGNETAQPVIAGGHVYASASNGKVESIGP